MTPTEPVEVAVGDAKLRLRFGGRAEYRLQSIGENIDLTGLRRKRKDFVTMANWAWALAVDCPFASPEDLADAIQRPQVAAIVKGILDAVTAATKPSAEKKTP